MTDLKGKRVRIVLRMPVLVEATVVEENEHGVVLDVDSEGSEIQIMEEPDADAEIVERYLHRSVPDAKHPTWLGRAHLDKLEVLP